MGMFKTNRSFPYTPASLAAVAEQVKAAFQAEGYEAIGHETPGGGQFISLTKGDTFKAVLGLKTALNIQMDPKPGGTDVEAKIGTYGEAFIGAAVAAFVFWPLILTQVAGVVESSKLDDRAMVEIEKALKAHANGTATGASSQESTTSAGSASSAPEGVTKTCSSCGASLPEGAKFCLECGAAVTAP